MTGISRSSLPMLNILTRGDCWLLLILLLGSIATLYQLIPEAQSGHTARIIRQGEVLYDLDLADDQQLTIRGEQGPVVVQVKNHEIQIIESECRIRFCIKSGAISKVNQIIVCVPNNIVIKILGNPGLDVITG